MALTPEDIAGIQEMINTGLMPQVEKLVEEKVAAGLSGVTTTIQGIISQSGNGAGDDSGIDDKWKVPLAILGTLAPLAIQVLPLLKSQQQTDPTAQFNQMASMMRTTNDIMLAPVMDIWRSGMSFGVNAVAVAQRASGPLPDARVFDQLINQPVGAPSAPRQAPSSNNGQMSAGADFDYDAESARQAQKISEKGYK